MSYSIVTWPLSVSFLTYQVASNYHAEINTIVLQICVKKSHLMVVLCQNKSIYRLHRDQISWISNIWMTYCICDPTTGAHWMVGYIIPYTVQGLYCNRVLHRFLFPIIFTPPKVPLWSQEELQRQCFQSFQSLLIVDVYYVLYTVFWSNVYNSRKFYLAWVG